MSRNAVITYYMHSGFSVAAGDTLAVFDYWRGEKDELPGEVRITPEFLAGFAKVFVFVSHEHADHFDPVIYEWRGQADNITYVVSDDMPIGTRGRRMAPGGTLKLADDVTAQAFGSTDLGVSYLVDIGGVRVFHAGDLNFWHWREESSVREIEEADEAFRGAVAPIIGQPIDVAFFPVDPRQGQMFDAGANYFIMAVKPRLLVPMHFWGRGDLVSGFARQSRTETTEIVALTEVGQRMELAFEDDGSIRLRLPEPPVLAAEPEPAPAPPPRPAPDGVDPFDDSDLPVKLED